MREAIGVQGGPKSNFLFSRVIIFLVVTVKKWLKSVYIYGNYRKIKTGVSLSLDHPVYSIMSSHFQRIERCRTI